MNMTAAIENVKLAATASDDARQDRLLAEQALQKAQESESAAIDDFYAAKNALVEAAIYLDRRK